MPIGNNLEINDLLLKGKVEFNNHRLDLAQAIFEDVLNLIPNELNALNFMGLIHLQNSQFDLSEKFFRLAISKDPTQAIILNNYGNLLKECKRWPEAIHAYEKAIQLDGACGEFHSNLGLALHESGQYGNALVSYDTAIKLNSDYLAAYYNLANTLKAVGQYEKALIIYEFVISREPNNSQALNNYGLTLKDLGHFDAALNNLILATRSNPNFYEAYLNLGNVYFDLAEFNLAIANYNHALNIKPNYVDALTNRGNIYFCLKEFEKALADHDHALRINPNSPNANWNKSLTLLMCGKYLDGWETYEWRHEMNKNNSEFLPRQFLSPLWLGKESLNNKIILIHSEQGLGDTIQFCRLISRVYELGAKIIFEVQTKLEDLLSCLSPFAKIVSRGGGEEHYDFHIPLLSLPHALKIEPSSIQNTTSYLKASKEKTAFWRKKLNWCNEFRVGLVWSGGFRPNQPDVRSVHQRRNINLKEFEGFHVPGMQLFSLQKGYPAEEDYKGLLNQNWKGPIIIDYTHELNDFSDTAAFIENLDLVISVDTSSAHLAGALGKSIWLLNRYDSCWRWMSDTNQSIWYSEMKIYRQDEIKNWEKVICMVKADLIHLIKSKDIS